MRPIPAPRLGDAHGLLRAISQRERLRLDEFVTEFSVDELFPAGLENALGRTRQFVSFARAAGLLKEDRGVVELTEVGKRYVRAGDDAHPFDVSSSQAEWLRRQLREKQMTDSIFHGAAIGLSLLASSPPDFRVSSLDFGRALAYLARAGWDNDNTFSSQGERYGTFLRDLELVDERWRLTSIGDTMRAELTLPIHMSLKDLAGQLNPGGVEAAMAEGEAEWTAREVSVGAAAALIESAAGPAGAAVAAGPAGEPAATTPAAPPVAPAREPVASAADAVVPAVIDTGEYQDVGPGAGPSRLAAPASDPRRAGGGTVDLTSPPEPAGLAPEPPALAPEPAGLAPEPAGLAPEPPALAPEPPALAPEPPALPPEPPARAPEPPVAAPEPPDDLWEVAAPDQATRGYRVVGAEPAPAPAPAPRPAVGASGFLDLAAVRASGEEAGLRLAPSVYAAAVAALATGRHVVLTGPPGSGKTTLALALARAATAGGRAAGAVLVTATRRWGAADTLGRRTDAGFEAGHVLSAAQHDRWLVLDELNRVHLDRALGALSTFLGGLPATLPDGSEAQPPRAWRIVATADSGAPLRGSAALLRRFARIEVPAPDDADLAALVDSAAGGDAVAAAAARRLLGVRQLRPLGAGVFLAAARHAAEHSALEPVGEAELARECLRAYVRPLLGDLDPEEEVRLRAVVP